MTLEWISPPTNYDEEADQIEAALVKRPNAWARIARDIGDRQLSWWATVFRNREIELRRVRVNDGWWARYWMKAPRYDLYARAPKEDA